MRTDSLPDQTEPLTKTKTLYWPLWVNSGHLTCSRKSSVTQSHCWVFSCVSNPPNSLTNERTWWSFLCVRIHTGVGHSEKLIKFVLRSWRDWNSGHALWNPTLYQLTHPATRVIRVTSIFLVRFIPFLCWLYTTKALFSESRTFHIDLILAKLIMYFQWNLPIENNEKQK